MMTTTQKISIGLVAGIMLATIMVLSAFISGQYQNAGASIQDGQSYTSTTTTPGTWTSGGATGQGGRVACNSQIGSVVVLGAAAGTIGLYDATTTNVTLRASNMSTTSITIAVLPASLAVGTYTFDRTLANGLYVDVPGTVPTTTVTCK